MENDGDYFSYSKLTNNIYTKKKLLEIKNYNKHENV